MLGHVVMAVISLKATQQLILSGLSATIIEIFETLNSSSITIDASSNSIYLMRIFFVICLKEQSLTNKFYVG